MSRCVNCLKTEDEPMIALKM